MAKSQHDALDLSAFERVDFARWRADVEAQLGGADKFARKLEQRLEEGIVVAPLYSKRPDFDAGAPRTPGGALVGEVGWTAAQRVEALGSERVAQIVEAELGAGARALWLSRELCFDSEQLAVALGPLDVERVALYLDAGARGADAWSALCEALGPRVGASFGVLGADPLGAIARDGGERAQIAESLTELGSLAGEVGAKAPRLRTALVSTSAYHDAGAHAVQELGLACAVGVAYLRALVDGGSLDIDSAAAKVGFSVCVGRDVFVEMCKLRALRRLWARVIEASGGSARAQRALVHAGSAWRTRTSRDPWVNMLRAVGECFAAATGGADAITIAPYRDDTEDELGRRIARNAHVILAEESSLGHVLDPAGGSYYVETLTDELTQRGWAELQRIERAGGVTELLASGQLARELAESAEARAQRVATRQHAITGVSEFANLAEQPLAPTSSDAPSSHATSEIAPLTRRREAADFEALRAASDAQLASVGQRPRVWLATLGPLRQHNARTGFARALLAAGGVEAPSSAPGDGEDDVAAAVRGLGESGARVACICGSDDAYAERAVELAEALAQANAELVLLAGRPPRDEALASAWKRSPIGGYIHLGCDAVAVLRCVHDVALSTEQS